MITNSSLDFRTTFHLESYPKDCSISDFLMPNGWDSLLTGYTETSSDVFGLFAIGSNNAGSFYNYTAFANNDFSIPQTTGVNPSISGITGVLLPLDNNQNVINDTYVVKYKTKINLASVPTSFNAGGATATITVTASEDYSLLFGADTNGKYPLLYIYATGGSTGDTYEITGITFLAGLCTFTVKNPNLVTTYSLVGYSIGIILEKEISVLYAYNKPDVDIAHTSSCVYSQLTVEDNTDYTHLFPFVTTQPTVSRSWNIQYPDNIKSNIIATPRMVIIGAGTSYNSGANIYTGYYNIALTSTYAISPYTYFTIQDSLITSIEHRVECSLCLCQLRVCYDNVKNKYKHALSINPARAEILQTVLTQLNSEIIDYMLAQRCGSDTGYICANIKKLLQAEDCDCDFEDETTVHEVLPSDYLTLITFNSGAITFGTGDAGFPMWNDGDIHIFTSNSTVPQYHSGDVYQKYMGMPVFKGNFTGGIGATGITGTNGKNGTQGTVILYNDFTAGHDIYGLNVPQSLKRYFSSTNPLITNGSFMVLETSFTTSVINNYTFDLSIGATILPTFSIKKQTSNNVTVYLKAIVTRTTDASHQQNQCEYILSPNTIQKQDTATTENLANPLGFTISANVTKTKTAGGTGNVTCNFLRITEFTK